MINKKETYYPNIGESWGIVGITILSMLVFGPALIFLNNILGKDLSFLVYYLLSMGGAFVVVHLIRKKRTGKSKYNFSFSSLKIMVMVSISIVALQLGIISPIVNSIPMPELIKKMFLEFGSNNGLFAFIAIVIAAPILEELIFRGIILNGLLKRYSPVKSIVISSILFGVVHLNPWQFVAAFLIGLLSGWVYYKTRKLSLSILIHFINNLIAFGSAFFTDAETTMNETLTESYGGLTYMILIIGGAIIVSIITVLWLKKEFSSLKIDKWQPTPQLPPPLPLTCEDL